MVASRVSGITWCLWALALRASVPKKLGSLVAEVGRGEAGGEESVATLPVEWVVDIADKDSDWFIATAYAYNGELTRARCCQSGTAVVIQRVGARLCILN